MIVYTSYIAYTDGGCQNTSIYGEGGSAYIILKDDKIIKTASKGFLNTSNNRMEILAIMSAVASIPEEAQVTIHSDSQYAIYTLTGRWKAKTNIDLIQKYRELAKKRVVSFVWVKGHNGNMYNEMVDELCTQAMDYIVKKNNLPANRFTKRKPVPKTLFDI